MCFGRRKCAHAEGACPCGCILSQKLEGRHDPSGVDDAGICHGRELRCRLQALLSPGSEEHRQNDLHLWIVSLHRPLHHLRSIATVATALALTALKLKQNNEQATIKESRSVPDTGYVWVMPLRTSSTACLAPASFRAPAKCTEDQTGTALSWFSRSVRTQHHALVFRSRNNKNRCSCYKQVQESRSPWKRWIRGKRFTALSPKAFQSSCCSKASGEHPRRSPPVMWFMMPGYKPRDAR